MYHFSNDVFDLLLELNSTDKKSTTFLGLTCPVRSDVDLTDPEAFHEHDTLFFYTPFALIAGFSLLGLSYCAAIASYLYYERVDK